MKENDSRLIKFLGGRSSVYTLVVLILVAVAILLYAQLDFIIKPILIIFSTILTPLVIAFILYYLIEPLVSYFEEKNINRTLVISVIYLVFIGLLTWLTLWFVPILQRQSEELLETLPTIIDSTTQFANRTLARFSLSDRQQELVDQGLLYLENFKENVIAYIGSGISGIGAFVSSVTSVLMTIFIVPVILFFLLKDGSTFHQGFMEKVPPRWRKDVSSVLWAIDTQVGHYIKGQIIIAAAEGVLMFIGFTLIGLNYSGILAVAGGFLSFIPYIGPTLTFVPAGVIALTDSLWMFGKLILVWISIQIIGGNLVEPNIMGRRLNVHPITIIFILLVMGEMFGLAGMLLGVPIYAILKVLVTFVYQKFKRRYNRYYGDAGEYEIYDLKTVYDSEDETEDK